MGAKVSCQEREKRIRELERQLTSLQQVEHTLGQTSVDYLSVLSQINDGVYLLDSSGHFLFVNTAIEKRSGIPLDQFIGLHFLDIIAPKHHKRVRKNFEKIMTGTHVAPYELEYVTRSGETLALEVNTQPVFRAKKIVGLLGVSRDITERKRAEQAIKKAHRQLEERVQQRTEELARVNTRLREEIEQRKRTEEDLRKSEEQFRTIFNSVNDCIFMKDRTLRYTVVNQCMERLFKRPASEIVGKTDQDLFGKEAAAHMLGVDSRVLEGHMCEEEDTKPVNGTMTTFHVVKVPMYDRKGMVVGLCGIARDMTKRKLSQEALRHSEKTVRALLNAATDVIFLLDTQGRIIALNETAARGFGKNVQQAVGLNVFDLIEPEVAQRRKPLADSIIQSKKPFRFQDERRGKYFDTNVCPILDERGEVAQLAVYSRNVTEQRQAVEKLKQAYEDVEGLVEKRTRELSKANERLAREIEDRMQTEKALREKDKELELKARNLEEANTALRVLLKSRNTDRTEIEQRILSHVKDLIMPYVAKLKRTTLSTNQLIFLNVLESNLEDIISPFAHKLTSRYIGLTATEIRVAGLVRDGKTSKAIGEIMDLSHKTIEFHRNNIRKKLGIKNTATNLRTYLMSI